MGAFVGALKNYGKKRMQRTKQKYTGGSNSSGSSGGGSGSSSDMGGAAGIVQDAIRRKRAGKSRG